MQLNFRIKDTIISIIRYFAIYKHLEIECTIYSGIGHLFFRRNIRIHRINLLSAPNESGTLR